jgi:hypothetical protein
LLLFADAVALGDVEGGKRNSGGALLEAAEVGAGRPLGLKIAALGCEVGRPDNDTSDMAVVVVKERFGSSLAIPESMDDTGPTWEAGADGACM